MDGILLVVSAGLLFVCCFAAVRYGLEACYQWLTPPRLRRWLVTVQDDLAEGRYAAYGVLLEGCGMGDSLSVRRYIRIRTALIAAAVILLITAMLIARLGLFDPRLTNMLVVLGILVLGAVWFDRSLLALAGQRRKRLMVQDLYELCRQLWYMRDSRLSLHGKLSRCDLSGLAVASGFLRMRNDWYSGSELAIERFQRFTGTEEGYSFGETLRAIARCDDPSLYELFYERMNDYKEKTSFERASGRETLSYLLFVLAGLPIVNTFRVFVYPWVEEGKKLFDALQS